jgi:hypothetical protein
LVGLGEVSQNGGAGITRRDFSPSGALKTPQMALANTATTNHKYRYHVLGMPEIFLEEERLLLIFL